MDKAKGIVIASVLSLSLLGIVPVFAAAEDAKTNNQFTYNQKEINQLSDQQKQAIKTYKKEKEALENAN